MDSQIDEPVSEASGLTPQYLESFCLRYFTGVGATIYPSPPGTLCVELPREVDKELTDRPFFWMWAEAMNENPPNTVLYLTFTEDAVTDVAPAGAKVERITPGCYRMLRIMTSAKNHGAFAAAYESAPVVTPYAVLTVKISYMSDRRKDVLEAFAVDLRDYQITANVMPDLLARQLHDDRPLATKILPVPVDFDQVFSLVMNCVQERVKNSDHTWAKEATKKLQGELAALDQYYASLATEGAETVVSEPTPTEVAGVAGHAKVVQLQDFAQQKNGGVAKPLEEPVVSPLTRAAEQELRRAEMIWRTEPRVEVRPMQCAMVYLAQAPRGDAVSS
ncbi:MAG: hypothetical protein OWT28_08720 [Firmicutes bacterium]|nr:hypothetical protein [Bacillota bacterium]